jgi:hypothetical protein
MEVKPGFFTYPKAYIYTTKGKKTINVYALTEKGKKVSIEQINKSIAHEIGHYYYYSENKCDNFAKNKMLKMGFNPSQIAKSIHEALSNKSLKRKIEIFENLKCEKL